MMEMEKLSEYYDNASYSNEKDVSHEAVDNNGDINISSMCLKTVPAFVLQLNCITSLNLNFNSLEELTELLCESEIRMSLRCLYIKGNRLKRLPHNIGLFTQLNVLDASENVLADLPVSFAQLCQLQQLKLFGNRLKSLPEEIDKLENLKQLHLDENRFRSIVNNLGTLCQLERLELGYNRLRSLPPMGQMKQLKYLNLSNNKLRALPESLGFLQQLVDVDISFNRLSVLPPVFESAPNLKKLYMERNEIVNLPPWFNQLNSLKELNIQDNWLKWNPFPDNFGVVCSRLQRFELAGNAVESLPDTFGLMNNLEYIHMGSSMPEPERRNFQNGNALTKLPENFGQLSALVYLRLDENQLKELPDSFGQLITLEYVDLCNNRLFVLPDSFGQLLKLKTCILSRNGMTKLPENFGELVNLNELRLDNNWLAELPKSFDCLTQLRILDLYNNNLTQLPTCLMYFKSLKYLDLDENEFNIPFEEVPIRFIKQVYPVGPKKKWRDRKSSDMSPNTNSVAFEMEKLQLEDQAKTIKSALQAGSAMWRTHGQTGPRKKFINNLRDPIEDDKSNETHQKFPTFDEEVDEESGSSSCVSSNWTEDEDDVYNGDTSNGKVEENFDKSYEDWDAEIELCGRYDDDDIVPNTAIASTIQSDFCPADDHVRPILRLNRPSTRLMDGQFSDAEEDQL